VRLTLIEWRILEEMATRPGILLSLDEWARLVWAGKKDSNALRTNVARLRIKLGPDGKLIRTETTRGYVWEEA
jgi:DNA-binding response OmpR family regulator